jgi:hypothetical protein
MAELNEVYRNRWQKRGVGERRKATIVARSHFGSVLELGTPESIPKPPPAGAG